MLIPKVRIELFQFETITKHTWAWEFDEKKN